MKIGKNKVRMSVKARGEETTKAKKKRERERGKEETQIIPIEAKREQYQTS